MPEKEDAIKKIINNTLNAMVEERKVRGNWSDGEREDITQSLLFKKTEALYTLILPVVDAPDDFNRVFYAMDLYLKDLNNILSEIEVDGFDPNPYLYFKGKTQFIDFASFILLFLSDLLQYYKQRKKSSKLPTKKIHSIIKKAIDFILECAYVQDEGASWASEKRYEHQGMYLNNVYFTTWAMIALEKAVSNKNIPDDIIERASHLIKQSIIWLRNRKKGDNFFGDQALSKTGLNYNTYALIALLHTFHIQDDTTKDFTTNFLRDYIKSVGMLDESISPSFIDSFIPETGIPSYYDDRITDGTILYVLCLARTVSIDMELMGEEYFEVMKKTQLRLLASRSENNLWNKGTYLITSNYWAVKSLILYNQYGEELEFNVSETDLISALKNTMRSPEILNILLKELQDKAKLKKIITLKEE